MKKLVIATLAFLVSGAAHALPVGNPSETSLYSNSVWCDSYCCDPCFSWCDAWSVRLGFYGDYVFNRHLEEDGGQVDGATLNDSEIFTNAGYIALNISESVDVFVALGTTQIDLAFGAEAFSFGPAEVASDTGFSWSVGVRATLWEYDCFALGVEGQYFQTQPQLNYILDFLTGEINHFADCDNPRYYEWQVGVGASYRIATSCPTCAMVPYMGVKWARSKYECSEVEVPALPNVFFPDFKSEKLWGWAAGMTITLCDMVGVNVEARFVDEKAISALAQFRF